MKTQITKAFVYDSNGIELFKQRKLKELISVDISKGHIGEEIFICDRENVHGIIILNRPNNLDKDFFKIHFSRHSITEDKCDDVWPNENKFNAHSFRIKKVFKKPFKYNAAWQEDFTIGEFVKDLEVIKDTPLNPLTEMLKEKEEILENISNKKAVEGKEELRELFVALYKLFIKRQKERL